jgi:hypothetical protein
VSTKPGAGHFTSPAVEWAESFRGEDNYKAAEFVLRDGKVVSVPSIVLGVSAQKELIESAGLKLTGVEEYSSSEINGPVSPKLLMNPQGGALVVLRGFSICRG